MRGTKKTYQNFIRETDHPYCWLCGRESFELPDNWHIPFLIERAHIVSKPRVEDRRVVALLCSRCHDVEHGEVFSDESLRIERPTLENLLWLKAEFDPEFYCPATLAKHHVGVLPVPKPPSLSAIVEFLSRKYYPAFHGIPRL